MIPISINSGCVMTQERKALEILRALADTAASGNSLTIAEDWGFGTATLIHPDGSHTHIGSDHYENEQANFEAFVNSLHDLLVAIIAESKNLGKL